MKNPVAKRSAVGISKNDIIAINAEAKKREQEGVKVINASIGTFLTEEKKVGSVSLMKEGLSSHITEQLGYPSVNGNPKYLSSVMDYLFDGYQEKLNELYHPFIGATIGGTGALSMAFQMFLEEGDPVLLPDVMWTNYKLISKKAHSSYETYQMFTEDSKINFSSLSEKLIKSMKEHERTLLVINDPCQNPTGYCMEEEEYVTLFHLLDEVGKEGLLTVLFDIAYLPFSLKPCPLFSLLTKKKYHFLPLIAFSASKIFGIYGLRVGALIALTKNELMREEVIRSFDAIARGTYSVPVGTALHAVGEVLSDKEKRKELKEEIDRNAEELKRRSDILLEKIDKNHIPHYPYKAGFFITLKVDHAYQVASKMKEDHIFVVPMNDSSIRLAISGISIEEIQPLLSSLVKAIASIAEEETIIK